ncbi:MAG: hypothetical protein M5R36_24330 [Deltaproteobacteria bacterium]|nr:hypothetical protein [Deltaproteobacteria bacterium]
MGAAAPMEEKAAEARDMEDLIDAPMAKSAMRQQTEAEQVFQQRLRAAQSSTDSYGALPARFAIPKAGSGLAFSEYITIGEASTLRLGYARRGLIDLLNLLPFLLTAALAWYARRLLGAGTMGTRAFFAAAALIVALAFAGLSVGMIVAGAVVGLGARFVLWTVTQIRLQRTMAKAG